MATTYRDTRPGNKRKKDAANNAMLPAAVVNVEQHGPRSPPPLLDVCAVLAFFGDINLSTLYRGINAGVYPRPINVSANVVRWLASECEAALAAMIARRDAGVRTTPRHGGRKKKVA
jgi:predicted DNA-binding transcriptional regulator AlpA